MSRVDLVVESDLKWSVRTRQVASMFELESKPSTEKWSFDLDLPQEWSIGLIVGASGSGKTTIARHLFDDLFLDDLKWPKDGTVIDGFDKSVAIKDVCGALSSVGFSSPPAWLRPYAVLSNGEKFRADVARALVADQEMIAIDEFTSVVDRTVAQIGSAAVSKAVRRSDKRLIAVSCHYDIVEWLQPDWVLHMPEGRLDRRLVQPRPKIELEIFRVESAEWHHFRRHHYLDHSLARSAGCFVACWQGRPVAFASAMSFPHAIRPGWREHRTVCLPDFQGVGIGNRLSELVGSAYRATGKPYRSTTSHPAMTRHRAKSKMWKMIRPPSRVAAKGKSSRVKMGSSRNRFTAGFEFVGPSNVGLAKAWRLTNDCHY